MFRLVLLGLWDDANGGLGANLVKSEVKRGTSVDQIDNEGKPDGQINGPNGLPQSDGQSKETLSNVPNDPDVPNGNDQNDQMD